MMKERKIMLEEARVKMFIGENADDAGVDDDDCGGGDDDNGDVERDKEFFLTDVKWDRRRLLMSINEEVVVEVVASALKAVVPLLSLSLVVVVGMMIVSSKLKIMRSFGSGRGFIRALVPHSSILIDYLSIYVLEID